jgi:hypothetical protein
MTKLNITGLKQSSTRSKDLEPAKNGTYAHIGSKGGSGSHTHGFTGTAVDMRVAYVDIIIANKD